MNYEQQYEEELVHQRSPSFIVWCLYGMLFGTVATFFLDPDKGRRRRALLRDKGLHYKKVSDRFFDQKTTHLQNVWKGLKARANKQPKGREQHEDYIAPSDF